MIVRIFKKSWIHILVWSAMLVYFFAAPGVFTRVFTKVGKPVETGSIPQESDRVVFEVQGIEPYSKDGKKVYNLFGWAILTPQEGVDAVSFVREIVLISGDEEYFFPVTPVYLHTRLPDKLRGIDVDWDKLGFYTFIDDDLIKPGRYRIGLVFKDPSSDTAYYRDKPVYYLIKTPNTLDLED